MEPTTHDTLSKLQLVREYLRVFHKATGLPLQFVPKGHPPSKPARNHRFTELAVRVVIGGKEVATLLSGQLFRGTAHAYQRSGEQARRRKRDKDADPIPVVSQVQFQALKRMLEIFGQHLTVFANTYLIASRLHEPQPVTRAKDFILARATEPLTIRDVAHHVHLTPDSLSRNFKKVTGMTVAEYLARVRVEKAKQLIADASKRIAEAAFACGFESIPYFNRVFKNYTGLSPSEYRESLKAEVGGQRSGGRRRKQQKRGSRE
jgi:AraC-like DNA-binding protein